MEKLDEVDINDEFLEERLYAIQEVSEVEISWFADITYHPVARVLSRDLTP